MSKFVKKIETKPFEGQKPGTSGLRKQTKIFMQEHYVNNFVQATFNAVGNETLQNATLVLGGDGRYFNKEMIQIILKMSAANGVSRVIVGENGLLSTPAVSAIIRRHPSNPVGGFILTASHNPGGPDNDCGIKYNSANGGPAPEGVTSKIYENTTVLTEYLTTDFDDVDIANIGEYKRLEDTFSISVIDSTNIYTDLMKEVFDFPKISKFFADNPDFKISFDGMHGVAGPYAIRVLHKELGLAVENLQNCVPLEDFGGGHPDPNLTYAHDLVKAMGLDSKGKVLEGVNPNSVPDMGAACDGDADRNMILGKQFFVTPSDSVAILAANAEACIPFFRDNGGLKAVSRSMPTSAALDLVAKKNGINLFEVPTGWKFFGNLMDAQENGADKYNPLICGEESFGTGSNHIREKDGLWAVLCWLSIMAHKNQTIEEIVREHWSTFGRNYYSRYDYENVEKAKADKFVENLNKLVKDFDSGTMNKTLKAGWELATVNIFEYHDPVDGSISSNQGWRFVFTSGSRFVFRLSGTGSVGATIRMYLEKYEQENLDMETAEALKDLVDLALSTSNIVALTGREEPTVIT
eukprot:maker-scaffold_7-snap-gene-11.56-mRNA-1 protein AED:0.03 eAED:0.03 QI:147/1/1/1/0.75/0.6/5/177/578